MPAVCQFPSIGQDLRSLQFHKQIIGIDPPMQQSWAFVVERMIYDGSLAESCFDAMTNDLDIVFEQSPGMGSLEWPRS